MRILVAGATGYVGSRLVGRLLAEDHDVVVLTRASARAAARPWADEVEVVEGAADNARDVTAAMDDVDTVIHLVHAMETGVADFVEAERRTARAVASAAELTGVEHIVYLGGLTPDAWHAVGSGGPEGANGPEGASGPDASDGAVLSPHLDSRVATGRRLAGHSVPVTELRASIVLGAGSASYELIRFVASTPFPLVLHPDWATGRCQPIAIPDLLDLLVAAVEEGPTDQHRIVEVGGPEVGRYHDLVVLLRELCGGVPTVTAPVPTLVSPVLTGQLVATLTPIDPATVAPLVASLAHDSVVDPAHGHEVAVMETGVEDALIACLAGDGVFASMPGDPDWVGATLDADLVVKVLGRLPGLPSRLVPGLRPEQWLSTAVDVVTAVRG